MAIDTTNAKGINVSAYVESARGVNSDWLRAFNIHRDVAGGKRIASLSGIGALQTMASGADLPSATMLGDTPLNLAYTRKGLQNKTDRLDATDIPGLVEGVARALGASAMNALGALAAVPFNTGFLGGGYLSAFDGVALFSAAHTTTGANRSNLVSSALDVAAVKSGMALLRGWKTSQAEPADLTRGGVYLVVPPALHGDAHAAVTAIYGGSNMLPSTIATEQLEVITWGDLTEPTAWFLVSKSASNCHLWLRLDPQYTEVRDSDSGAIKQGVFLAAAAGVGPQPDGIVGGKP